MALDHKRIVVYTCITGGYDDLLPPLTIEPQIDYVCFIDKTPAVHDGWGVVPIPDIAKNNAVKNRFIKMHPHILFPNHEISIYIDGNIQILGGITSLVRDTIKKGDIALYKHPLRNCIYAEAEECAAIGHDWKWRITKQMNKYRDAGFPPEAGLYEGSVILRRHHQSQVRTLMEAWWNAYQSGTKRDQLSLTFLAWKLAIPIICMGESDPRYTKRHFSLQVAHKKKNTLPTRVKGKLNLLFR